MRPAATVRSTLPLTLAALMGAGCYSPNDDVVPTSAAGDDDTGGGSSGDTDDGVASSASSATSNATSTSSTSASSTSASSTSADPSDSTGSTPTETSADASTGEPADPYCGDGNVDPGEECDLAGDNALTAECRPDCNLARCGDGDVWAGGEGCDDGDGNNVLEIGACAPDCSRVIEEKVIELGEMLTITDGDFGNNPVAFADATCDPGYLAMFSYPNVREAALDPFDSSGSIDWVLQPYTAYTRNDGTLLWITDDQPLLGVRDGEQGPLLEPLLPACQGFCFTYRTATGIDTGWTTRVENTCSLWSSSSPALDVSLGGPYSVTDFLDYDDAGDGYQCDGLNWLVSVYCVEQ
jgi:hypothetical protein